jgi:hypothetical protein
MLRSAHLESMIEVKSKELIKKLELVWNEEQWMN